MKRKLSKLLGIGLTIALLTSLLVVAVPASAISVPVVTFDTPYVDDVIGAEGTYIIKFDIDKQLTGNFSALQGAIQDRIVITFPEGTVVDNTTFAATIVADAGWITDGVGVDPQSVAPINVPGTANWSAHNLDRTLTYALDAVGAGAAGSYIGEGAQVRIEITAGFTNPTTPGDYTLTVETLKTDDGTIEGPITSAEYSIVTPGIQPLAGIVYAKNSAGILMAQSHNINTCIAAAKAGGTVEVGPGTYSGAYNANVAGQTIIGTGEPGTVIIGNGGTLAVSAGLDLFGNGVTVDGITFAPSIFMGENTLIDIQATANKTTIQNCDITAGKQTAITVNGAADRVATISNCTITATSTKYNQVGIDANAQVNVNDCTFTVGAKAVAIDTSAGGPPGVAPFPFATSISGNEITGSSGKGIMVTGGSATISSNTFGSLTTALDIDAGAATAKMNTVDGCGSASLGKGDAITIDGAGTTAKLYNNTIQNSAAANYAINIGAGTASTLANCVYIHFNNILDNTKNIKAGNGANVTAINNWWGSAAGPAVTSIDGLLPGAYTPSLGSSNADADVGIPPIEGALSTKATVGVDMAVLNNDGTKGAAGILAVSKYEVNPEITSPPIYGTGNVLGYYDIYANGVVGDKLQLKFYGAVTKYTKVYYAGGITGQWAEVMNNLGVVQSGVNVAGGYAYCTITNGTSLSIDNLGGTVFAVVDDQTDPPPDISAIAGGSPVVGAYDISVMPMFTWDRVTNAVRYEIMLCEDPTFTIIEWAYNVDNPFFKVEDEALRYGTTYYWRVRGVLNEAGTAFTPWTTGIFTTEEEPEEVVVDETPIEVNASTPEVSVEIPPTKITVEPGGSAIPNYMLWIIIVVGAVLIISLIVLIVRTRRVV
jgi:hypothetical protein